MVNNVYKCDTDNVEKAEGISEKSKIQFLILNSDFSFNNASIISFPTFYQLFSRTFSSEDRPKIWI